MPTHPRTHARPSTLWIVLVGLLLSTAALAAGDEPIEPSCAFDPEWIISPDFVDEVGFSEDDGKDSSFCDFYQFSWQNFLYLVSPAGDSASKSGNAYKTQFQNTDNFLPYTSKKGVNPCAGDTPEHTFFGTMPTGLEPRDWKSLDDPDVYQAGSKAVIYDQNGNAVMYTTRFNRDLCDVQNIVPHSYFPASTTELKMAWRVLTEKDDTSLYYTIDAPPGSLGKKSGTTTLGLIGFHIAIVTDAHPEMIWITIEHNLNDPYCRDVNQDSTTEPIASHDYSFTDSSCIQLAESQEPCTFNEPKKYTQGNAKLTGTPTEICQQYPFGQLPDTIDPNDNDNPANQAAISQLYSAFTSYVEDPKNDTKETQWAKVWTNYRMVGALWLSQPYSAKPRLFPGQFNSSDCDKTMQNCYQYGNPGNNTHQRGSLALANSVAETDFQGPVDALDDDGNSRLRNCFGCHQFTTNTIRFLPPVQKVTKSTDGSYWDNYGPPWNRGTGTISHIFSKIFEKQCKPLDEAVQPLFPVVIFDGDAQAVTKSCTKACQDYETDLWTGKFVYADRLVLCVCCEMTAAAAH